MPSVQRTHKKLLHSRPANAAQYSDNLIHLNKHEQVHRLQQQHHLRVAHMHADQAKVLQRLSTTNQIAKVHHAHENNLAERHRAAAGLHGREIARVKILHQRQANGLRKLQKRSHKPGKLQRGNKKPRRHRSHAKDEGKLGNISRDQIGTKFGINQVFDYNRGVPRITPQNLFDGLPTQENLQQLRKTAKRLKARAGSSKLTAYLDKKIFKIGTLTNLPPSGIYNDPKQFGFTRSTM